MRAAIGLAAIALVACGASMSSRDALVKRASFDMRCAPADLRYAALGDKAVGVIGCGVRATYLKVCHSYPYDDDCQWVLDSLVRDPSPTPPARDPGAL